MIIYGKCHHITFENTCTACLNTSPMSAWVAGDCMQQQFWFQEKAPDSSSIPLKIYRTGREFPRNWSWTSMPSLIAVKYISHPFYFMTLESLSRALSHDSSLFADSEHCKTRLWFNSDHTTAVVIAIKWRYIVKKPSNSWHRPGNSVSNPFTPHVDTLEED